MIDADSKSTSNMSACLHDNPEREMSERCFIPIQSIEGWAHSSTRWKLRQFGNGDVRETLIGRKFKTYGSHLCATCLLCVPRRLSGCPWVWIIWGR